MTIPLITSVPPRMSRIDDQGIEIGKEYFTQCAKSWHTSGFSPYSINSKNESVFDGIKINNINEIKVDRDYNARFGKPLLSIGDFLQAAANTFNGPVAFTNSDIITDFDQSDLEALANIQPGQCAVLRRIDIDDNKKLEGSEYLYGFDFFVYHSEDLKKFLCDFLYIGLPWWDHYLPIFMDSIGVRSIPIKSSNIYHLKHDERWNQEIWLELGDVFINNVKLLENNNNSEYFRSLKKSTGHLSPLLNGSVKSLMGVLTATGRKSNRLHQTSNVNIHWIKSQQ